MTNDNDLLSNEENLKHDLTIIMSLSYQNIFLKFLKTLPAYITKKELEIYLILLKSKKEFSSKRELHKYIEEQYKNNKDKLLLKSYDTKLFFGNKGYFNNLIKSGLLAEYIKNKKLKYAASKIRQVGWIDEDIINLLESYLHDIRLRVGTHNKINKIIKDMTAKQRIAYLTLTLERQTMYLDIIGRISYKKN